MNGIWSVIGTIINVLAIGILIAGTIAVIWAGVMYMTARNNNYQVEAAKKRLINIALGLGIYALMYMFLAFIIPGGVSKPEDIQKQSTEQQEETARHEEQKQPEKREEQKQEPQKQQPEEQQPEEQQQSTPGSVTATIKEVKPIGYQKNYQITELSAGAVPYVYAPNNGHGEAASSAIAKLKNTKALVVINAGAFEKDGRATGTTITGGSVLTTGESCTSLVIGQNGKNPGWAEKDASASGLVGGTTSYYDMNGNQTIGKIYSAVSCFSPIIVGGKIADGTSSSFNFKKYSGHYRNTRARQILCVKGSPSNPLYSIISNKNEGTTGGWNWGHMTTIAKDYGCVYAYNLDGGGSTATWTRNSTTADFTHYGGSRSVPTYIVFTADNQPIK
jgi:exopolysaccharide biosynthesis protein